MTKYVSSKLRREQGCVVIHLKTRGVLHIKDIILFMKLNTYFTYPTSHSRKNTFDRSTISREMGT